MVSWALTILFFTFNSFSASIISWLKDFFFSLLFTSATIGVEDVSFRSVLRKCESLGFRVTKRRVHTTRKLKHHPIIGEMQGKEKFSTFIKNSKTKDGIFVYFTSDYTTYWGMRGWRFVIITRVAGSHSSGGGWNDQWIQKDGEKIVISTLNVHGSYNWLNTFFIETIEKSLTNEQLQDTVFTHERALYPCGWLWKKNITENYSTVESTILKKGLWNDIIDSIKVFIKSGEYYKQKNVPYRIGILLHGPPGTGKTSIIKAIAKHFNFQLALMRITESELRDSDMRKLFQELPKNAVLVLEDIDVILNRQVKEIEQRKKKEMKYSPPDNGVTLSGVLNVLDGIEQRDDSGLIVFATTNYFEKLPDELVRDGRFDKKYFIGYADEYQSRKMFEKIIGKEKIQIFEKCKDNLLKIKKLSCAKLQRIYMQYRHDPIKLPKYVEFNEITKL
jgi:hypothetical protein